MLNIQLRYGTQQQWNETNFAGEKTIVREKSIHILVIQGNYDVLEF